MAECSRSREVIETDRQMERGGGEREREGESVERCKRANERQKECVERQRDRYAERFPKIGRDRDRHGVANGQRDM